eukprot:406984_1
MRHINAKSAQESNWYDTHRSTVGNLKWMFRWFIPILCIQFAICLVTSSAINADRIIYYATNVIFHLLIIIAWIFIYCNTPSFADVFRLRDELRYVLCIGVAVFISGIITAIIDNSVCAELQPNGGDC